MQNAYTNSSRNNCYFFALNKTIRFLSEFINNIDRNTTVFHSYYET